MLRRLCAAEDRICAQGPICNAAFQDNVLHPCTCHPNWDPLVAGLLPSHHRPLIALPQTDRGDHAIHPSDLVPGLTRQLAELGLGRNQSLSQPGDPLARSVLDRVPNGLELVVALERLPALVEGPVRWSGEKQH